MLHLNMKNKILSTENISPSLEDMVQYEQSLIVMLCANVQPQSYVIKHHM